MRIHQLTFIILLGVAGYYGYSLYDRQKKELADRDEKIARLEKKLAVRDEEDKGPSKNNASTPLPSTQKVICPACAGEGNLMYRPSAGDIQTRYPCPVCNGAGGRGIALPKGSKLCPDCSGLGKRLYCSSTRSYSNGPNDLYRMTGRPCKRCSMHGYVQADIKSSP